MEYPDRDRFCLVCALFTTKEHREKLTDLYIAKYERYFNVKLVKSGIFRTLCVERVVAVWTEGNL